MLEMKKFWTCTKIGIIVVFIIVAIMVPFGINEAYMKNDGYITIWGAEDVFAFWGDVVGAGATILAVVYTILYTEFTRKKDKQLSVQPYINTYFSIWESEDIEKKQWDYEYAIVFGKDIELYGTIVFPNPIHAVRAVNDFEVTEDTKDIFHQMKLISAEAKLQSLTDFFIFDYEIENVGIGTAIDIQLLINKHKAILPFSITANNSKKYLFVCDLSKLQVNENWNLQIDIAFCNVYKTTGYLQKESFSVHRNDDEQKTLQISKNFDQAITVPKEILISDLEKILSNQ